MKRCTKCGESKPLEAFTTSNRSKDGREARCRPCRNATERERWKRASDSERAKKRANAKRLDPAKARERTRRWRERNPEKVKAANATTKARLGNEYFREWYARNRESQQARSREVMRQNRRDHPEQELARKRRYRAKHLDIVRAREREKAYARRALQPYSPELVQLMAELVEQPCTYCGAAENITIDHIVPLSRGGKHEAANLAPACLSCNSSKCNRLLSEWEGRAA